MHSKAIEDLLVEGTVARKNADCADGNKDVKIEATLFIPRQKGKPNQAVKFRCEIALICLYDTYEQCGCLVMDCKPRHGQIICLGLDLNQNSNLHQMSQHRAS